MGEVYNIPLVLRELSGVNRIGEPITCGIPIRKGIMFNTKKTCLIHDKKTIPVQTEILAKWPDNSIKWLLLDFKARVRKSKTETLCLCNKKTKTDKITKEDKEIIKELLENILLFDKKNIAYLPSIKKQHIETRGTVRTTIKIEGNFSGVLEFIARFSFYSNNKLVKLEFTLKNSRAAEHKAGFWDLGDKGSVLFKELSIVLKNEGKEVLYKEKLKNKLKKAKEDLLIYQDSSGKKNWKSKNHVNRKNKVMNLFKGYRVYSNDKIISKGERAQPIITIKNKLSVSVKDFWQNFPKAIEANKSEIKIGLFPRQYNDLHELQAGEQKTHTIFFDFEGKELDWIQEPIIIASTPEYYAETKAIPYLSTLKNSDQRYQKLIDAALLGKDSFEKKNEIIDEYGWRNYGEVYADHEAIKQKGLISHYNNQYDVINGALLQFFKSGDDKWLKIAEKLAEHVRDIDIYHTVKDRAVYNNGMFWHTFHYMDAATCTHRSFSKRGAKKMSEFSYGIGGGPNSGHNYATGLMNQYFINGDSSLKETVIGLADWVINMDDGSKSQFRYISNNPTGKASVSDDIYYHGPGRGSGNSINVLMDGYEISGKKKYLLKAEELIRRCIHPKDDISKNNLEDVEHRWFYLVFLQALGRYIDLKEEQGIYDYMFYYAKESLVHYSRWILENEVPYKEVLDKVDIPSETWIAQDIRKTIVLNYTYKYSKNKRFKEKAEYFFDRCIKDLNEFKTKTFTRPLAILMHYSVMHDYFRNNKEIKTSFIKTRFNFGKPKQFKPQGYYFYKMRNIKQKMGAKK